MSRTISQDIRLLGDVLGETLRAQGGERLFQQVERMRLAALAARDAPGPEGDDAGRELAAAAACLTADEAVEVAHAFTTYFRLVNLAEDVERTRVIRRREREAQRPVPESLADAFARLRARGADPESVRAALADLTVSYVFTSHPTEARRRTTERLLHGLRRRLMRLDRERLTPEEEATVQRGLRAGIEALWQHAELRERSPTVLDEVKAGLWYVRHVLLDTVPRFQRRLLEQLEAGGWEGDPGALAVPVRIGSWMGGDRDGNPHVTDAVTERALEMHRHIVLNRYLEDLDGLGDALAAHASRLSESPELSRALERAMAAVPEVEPAAAGRAPAEPLRHLLTLMRERVARAVRFEPGGYPDAPAFLEDLAVLRRALEASGARALPRDALLELVWRVRCFGFHLAVLDVREDARVHREVMAELLGRPDYPRLSDGERREALKGLTRPPAGADLSTQARRLLDLFATLARLQARFGPEALHTYVISMAESPADVLEVARLAELHGLQGDLDIVPLLETRPALLQAGPLLRALLADPEYARWLERRGRAQELLLGYSDSMKEAGMLASRVGVRQAQVAAAEACAEAGVRLRVFHGRGGSVSRGGGPTHRALLALPRRAFGGEVKITEQGETRAFHFGDPDLALRYLERTLGAALEVRWEARRGLECEDAAGDDFLGALAEAGHRAYRELVDDPDLMRFFTEATPFDQIAKLNIASRPASRGRTAGLSDLRAIPWVFSWSQSRWVLTGWYGVGTALAGAAEGPGGWEALRELSVESPFLRDLLDNVASMLAKADPGIAARYAALCTDDAVRERFQARIRAEYDRTVAAVLALAGQGTLLEDDPVLQRSIRRRNPYVDPLSHLQVEALARTRAGDEAWQAVGRATVGGIAAGLRNTG